MGEAYVTGKEFMNAVASGKTDIIQLLLNLLEDTGSAYCVIGGLAVNAYAEPVVSLDLDLVVVSDRMDALCEAARSKGLKIQGSEYSVMMSISGSDLRIQLQTDPRYQDFLPRAALLEVLGYRMVVAALEDVLQGKVWAYSDEHRRKSKRQKDLSDITRLVETHPALKEKLPPIIRSQVE
jgi:hypothetical protein